MCVFGVGQTNVATEAFKLRCAGRDRAPTTMLELAREVLRISRGGLERRGHGEEVFLSKLEAIASKGTTQAEDLEFKVTKLWNGNIDPLFVGEFM